jgi:DNA repair exonuclease SbcCD ATPase subunit
MKAADQREIIENLLGITILSEKASALKELIRESKDAVTKEQAIIDATAQANQKIQESVNLLIRRQLNWKTQRDDDCIDLHHKIEKLKDIDIGVELRNHELLKKYNDNYTKFENISQQKQTVAASVTQAEKTVSRYFNELETLDNNKCPQCSQSISDHKHFEMMETVAKLYQDAADYLSQVNAQAELLQEDYDRVSASLPKIKPTTIYKSLEQALKHQNYLENYEKSLKQKINEPDPYQDQIDELKQSAIQRISYDKINELIKIKDHQEFLLKLLTNKDSFIRKKIIDQNLSYLNTRLSTYLEKIGLPHRVIFHNDLSVEISHMGHDSDFHNLSRGEMTRLSLSLSFAFRDVWENLYQPINMMVIDEQLDSGTDAAGVFAAVDILQSMVYERNKNIFLISHKEELTSKINNVLIATKENGFTSYAFL